MVSIRGLGTEGKLLRTEDYIKVIELSDAQKAEQAKILAGQDPVSLSVAKRLKEIEKNNTVENNGIYTPNVSSLSLETAKKNLGFAQLMIERHEDVGSVFHGHYGDAELKNPKEWEAALKDYIGKQEAAAAMYGKVQDMS
jgi:hypothetical protein